MEAIMMKLIAEALIIHHILITELVQVLLKLHKFKHFYLRT